MSQYSMLLHSENRMQINYPCGPFNHTLKENIALKQQRIRITTSEETFHASALWPKFGNFSWQRLTVRKVKHQLTVRVDPHTQSQNTVFKNQLIRLRTLEEEAFVTILPPSKNCELSVLSQFSGDKWVA